ncbi:MAG TPA: tetratricopeptide repeat protein, partial [Acidobacteriaceae bacterium]|nr:tetratricopeptide repeat protein [Acidobacteriaceae bacterium]
MIERRARIFTPLTFALLACTFATTPAFAVNKDMVQLQTEIQDLQQAVSHLQQSNDERMGVLRDLVQQTADSVNKLSLSVGDLQQQMHTQQEAGGGKLDQLSGQVQSLNDSLDEVKAHLNSLEKSLQSVANQQQSINATLQNIAPAAAGATTAPPSAAPAKASGSNQTAEADAGKPSAGTPLAPQQAQPAAAAEGQSVVAAYNAALNDYMAAKYALATTEFNQVIQTNPSDPRAGNSYYYLGEIDYRAGKYTAAIKDYDHVLSQYPSNIKIPVSHLHKAQALLEIKDRDAAI